MTEDIVEEFPENYDAVGESLSLEAELMQFIGTEQYHQNFGGLLYTDGVKYLADKAGAHWLVDLVGSYQPKLRECGFQLWTIEKMPDQSAEVYCQEDIGEPMLVNQKIEWTDFPLKKYQFYCVDNILMLPSEY